MIPTRLVSNSDTVNKFGKISPGLGVHTGHQCSLIIQTKSVHVIFYLSVDHPCNNNLR